MRVALVHDWLTGLRGGERVLHEVAQWYPDADLYTLIHVPDSTTAAIEARRIFASPLSRLPGAGRHYRKFLPLFPWAIRRFDLTGYELVISISHAFAKSVRTPPGAVHVCYCLTPIRYVWDQTDHYLGRGLTRALASPLAGALRRFDERTSGPESVTRFVGISHAVVDRIRRHYRRRADVVHPPVALDRFRPSHSPAEDFYLMVSAFVPYKAELVALEAFRRMGRKLVVVGDGPSRRRLQAGAAADVAFAGRVSDAELAQLYARCRALVMPQEEDFGIAAVEAQAAGRPVIAFGRGGARDTVLPLPSSAENPRASFATGIWFDAQSPQSLAEAVERFEKWEAHFDPNRIRAHAERFSVERFRSGLRHQIEAALRGRAAENPAR